MRDHLATLLDDLRRHGREVAVVHHEGIRRRVTTYGEIARLAGRFAALLALRGVEPGDRVLLWAENSAEWIAAFYGCLLRGVLAVPLDASGSADFAARVAADVAPKLAVGDELLLGQLPGDDRLAFPRLTFEDWLAALPAEEAGPVAGLSRETPLEILFTSGTTGDPKGIVITHGNVLASVGPIEDGAQPYMRYEWLIHPLRILHTLPLSHVFGQTMGLWVPPIFTAELHFENRLVAQRLIETIHRERISVLAAVPRVHALLKTHLEATLPGLAERVAASQGMNPWLRWWRFRDVHSAFGLKFWALISGGGALPGPLEQFWNALGFVLVQGYGMTETTALITLNHPFHVARGTIGKPMPGREVKLGLDGEVLVRGASISGATWQGGALHRRADEWLATGDLVQAQPSGELRFLGRKSEVIVTAAGVNLHPEDLEEAIEQEPGVAACAVVPLETAAGPEPCAVLAFRGEGKQAATAIERANARLAPFQRLSRWVLWPEPDLPRTSTGKVRRKAVAEWLAGIQAAASKASSGAATNAGAGAFGASSDWLLVLIAQISGEAPSGVGDELRLTEDLHLDSLGRVQLAAAIEERLGMVPESGLLEEAQTLGELRQLVAGTAEGARTAWSPALSGRRAQDAARSRGGGRTGETFPEGAEPRMEPAPARYIYPRWPWLLPFRWLRTAFIEAVMRPLVWLLAHPAVVAPQKLTADAPLLIVANHVTTYDGPLIQYALPGSIRRRLAVAMSGEMLEDFRHFRNPDNGRFDPFGPLAYLLLTELFNVFPLARQRDFQPSFAHAGQAMDRGFNVLVFPEGTRSAEGALARFRPGIGLLARQSGASVLPIAIRGLGELKMRRRRWFRSGILEVRVGRPIRFSPAESESAITARLHAEVEKLLNG
ncbi:MAG: AMP-binding protein [Terracidiphilus sp.]|jgi:long-chain acyl-CoA synthetase